MAELKTKPTAADVSYIKKLADVDMKVLRELITQGVKNLKTTSA